MIIEITSMAKRKLRCINQTQIFFFQDNDYAVCLNIYAKLAIYWQEKKRKKELQLDYFYFAFPNFIIHFVLHTHTICTTHKFYFLWNIYLDTSWVEQGGVCCMANINEARYRVREMYRHSLTKIYDVLKMHCMCLQRRCNTDLFAAFCLRMNSHEIH